MRKLALIWLLTPVLALAQTQIGPASGTGAGIQIGGNQPGVSSIQGATGTFTFDGAGFAGCTTTDGVTTCTFNTGSIGLTTNGDSGLSLLSGSTLNIPANHGGNVFGYANFSSLVGAFTDSSGNVLQPIYIGNGPATFAPPIGATQLQLGVNDNEMTGTTGSWTVSVNGTNYTVDGKSFPWLHTAGINAQYPTGSTSGGIGPTVVPLVNGVLPVTIQYVSGTVTQPTGITGCTSPLSTDANGFTNCSLYSSGGTFLPGYWTQIAFGGGFSLTTTGTSGPATYTGGVLNIPQYSGGGGTPGGASGNLQYNNAGAFGGDTNTNDDGAGNLTAKSYSATGTTNGLVNLTSTGTPGSGAPANTVQLTVPNAVTAYGIELPGAQPSGSNTFLSCSAANPAVCSWAAGGGGGGSTNPTFDSFGADPTGATDSTTAMQNCLNSLTAGTYCVPTPGATYKISSALTIGTDYTGIVGAQVPAVLGNIGPPAIKQTTAGADIIQVHGASTSVTRQGVILQNFTVTRSVQPTGTAAGISLWNTSGLQMSGVESCDSIYDFDLSFNPYIGLGYIKNNNALWNCGLFAWTGTNSLYGFHAVGSGSTTLLQNNVAAVVGGTIGGSQTTYGFYGSALIDYYNFFFNSSNTTWGEYYTGGGRDIYSPSGSHDQNKQGCYHADGTFSGTTLMPAWCNSVGAYGADIEATGITLSNGSFFEAGSTASIYLHNASATNVTNNRIVTDSGNPIGIQVDNSVLSNIGHNQVRNSNTSGIAYKFTNSSLGNNLFANMAYGTAVSSNPAYSFDATSGPNIAANFNQADGGAWPTALSDLAGNNSFVLKVNGTGVANANLNDTTPSVAATTGVNNKYQVSSSSVSSYTPVATSSVPGVIKPDGTTCTVGTGGTAGVLTCTGSAGATSIPICTPASASGTAYTCTTSPSFTPVAGSVIAFKPDVSNSSTSATLNVNSTSAAPIAKWQTTTTLVANDFRAGSYTVLTFDGTNWEAQTIGNAPSGGGSGGFPFTIIQSAASTLASGTSFTYTFPAALQSSGATAMLILGVDASGAFTAPSGWTCTINVSSGTNFPRLVVCLVASAGQTTVSFSSANAMIPSLRFYELSGSRSFDVNSTGYAASAPTVINFPSITPSSGAAVFAVATGVNPNATQIISQYRFGRPDWQDIDFSGAANNRALIGGMYLGSSNGTAITPPQAQIIFAPLSSSGIAYATFSIK